MNNEYYVYGIFSDEKLLYVGKGKGSRMETHLTGCSSSSLLNAKFFEGVELFGHKFVSDISENRAKLREQS